jgi:hypothetical protein
MTNYGMLGSPLALASALSMAPGEFSKQKTLYTVTDDRLFIIEYIGIHSSLQASQELSAAIMPAFNDGTKVGLTVYPIAISGTGASHNPAMPLRRFGSQELLLYANDRVDISALRSSDGGEAHIEFNISGRLLESA